MELLERGMQRERLLYRSQQTYRGCVHRFLNEVRGCWAGRVTCLPVSLVEKLREQDAYAAGLWQSDRDNKVGPVWMPESVRHKYPKRGFEEGEFWLLPASGKARGERWGNVRHHICADTLSKAIPIAARRARVLKHVKAHGFRHTFATEYLQNGGVITDLQNLLGHTNIATTQIYAHCLPRLAARIESPLDRKPANIVEMSQFEAAPQRRAFA